MSQADDRGNTRIIHPAGQHSYDNFHFAPAVRDGDNLRLSFESVRAVLTEAGAEMADITDITSFHVGLQAHMGTFMSVKDEFVNAPYPAWTAIGCTELAIPGALVEIQVIARKQ